MICRSHEFSSRQGRPVALRSASLGTPVDPGAPKLHPGAVRNPEAFLRRSRLDRALRKHRREPDALGARLRHRRRAGKRPRACGRSLARARPHAQPDDLPQLPGAQDRHAASVHALVRDRRHLEDPIIALACFYPTFINAYYGAKSTPKILVWSALNLGASPCRVFCRVVVPSALPLIFAGLRVSLALSYIVMFAAEMINADSGLGHLIRVAESGLRFDLMYVSLLSIAILGYLSDSLLRVTRTRLLTWQELDA